MNRLTAQIGALALLAIGLGFALVSIFWLDLGTPRRMGAGAFPMLVGGLLALLALVTIAEGLRQPVKSDPVDWLAVATVIGAVGAFAFVSSTLGVIPGTALSVLIGSLSAQGLSWTQRLILSAVVAVGVWVVFVLILKMPLVAIRGL